jgi:hypothetical protein
MFIIDFYTTSKALPNFISNLSSINFQIFELLINLTNFSTFATTLKTSFTFIQKVLKTINSNYLIDNDC